MTIVTDEMVKRAIDAFESSDHLVMRVNMKTAIEAIAPDLLAQGVRMGLAETRKIFFDRMAWAICDIIDAIDVNQIVKDAI